MPDRWSSATDTVFSEADNRERRSALPQRGSAAPAAMVASPDRSRYAVPTMQRTGQPSISPDAAAAGATADVGVVVIGRNEGERLLACLASLAPSGLPVTYVDSGSTDGSREAARAAGAEVIVLDLARPFTAARARDEGVAALLARAPGVRYLQFVDGDCAVAAGWIDTARAFLDVNAGYAVACGRRRERRPEASLYNRLADTEWATPMGDTAACGGDSLVRVEAYRGVGGFDAALIAGEEPELCSRLREAGWRIRRLDAEMTVHDAAMTRLGQWWNRSVRGGFGYAQAWQVTRRRPGGGVFGPQLVRAAVWTVGPAAVAVIAALAIHPTLLLLAPAIYAAQIARLARRYGGDRFAWQRAALMMLGKVAEARGALRYVATSWRGETKRIIEYK